MNIVFFGSSQFAVASLRALLNTRHKILCVVTQPDREKGRGLRLEGTPVKTLTKEAGLEIYQPPKINTPSALNFLSNLNPDLFVVIAYGQILSQGILDIPKIFAINAHASILPKYRGAAPINWAIIKGEKSTGVTIIKMTAKMDAGAVIEKKEIEIMEIDTAKTLEEKLSGLAAQLLIDSLEVIENNSYKLVPQDEGQVSFAPKLKKEDGLINWNNEAKEINNLIRGCLEWPGAFTYYKGKLLKIYKATVSPLPVSPLPGEILEISKEGIAVTTGKDSLVIQELQIEGKKRMRAQEFIAGHRIRIGDRLGD